MFSTIIAILVVIFVALIFQSKKQDPQKILGVYSQPGKWYYFKYLTFCLILFLRRLKFIIYGKEAMINENKIEQQQELSVDDKGFDAVFFQAVTQNGFFLAAGNEKRQNAKTNGLLYLRTPEHGLLLSEKLPNTILDTDPESMMTHKIFAAEGIKFTPIKPMKQWNIEFQGKMKSHENPKKIVDVKMDGIWTSDLPYFLFEVDLPISVIAKSIALETWDKDLFRALKEAHQTHYEQMGCLHLNLTIDGKEHKLIMDAFRDHSFGYRRDWTLMHRYIFHIFYLSDGTKVSLGVISQPSTSSHMTFGHMVLPDKTYLAIKDADLLLYQHAENGNPPDNLSFTFVAGGKNYEVQINYEVTAIHYVGNNVEAKMHERFLSCEINGVKGKGISEWHYNNVKYFKKC